MVVSRQTRELHSEFPASQLRVLKWDRSMFGGTFARGKWSPNRIGQSGQVALVCNWWCTFTLLLPAPTPSLDARFGLFHWSLGVSVSGTVPTVRVSHTWTVKTIGRAVWKRQCAYHLPASILFFICAVRELRIERESVSQLRSHPAASPRSHWFSLNILFSLFQWDDNVAVCLYVCSWFASSIYAAKCHSYRSRLCFRFRVHTCLSRTDSWHYSTSIPLPCSLLSLLYFFLTFYILHALAVFCFIIYSPAWPDPLSFEESEEWGAGCRKTESLLRIAVFLSILPFDSWPLTGYAATLSFSLTYSGFLLSPAVLVCLASWHCPVSSVHRLCMFFTRLVMLPSSGLGEHCPPSHQSYLSCGHHAVPHLTSSASLLTVITP